MAKKKLPPEILEYFKKQGSKGGKVGGAMAAANMTPEERSARAKKAAEASAASRKARAVKKAALTGKVKQSADDQSAAPKKASKTAGTVWKAKASD